MTGRYRIRRKPFDHLGAERLQTASRPRYYLELGEDESAGRIDNAP